MASELAIDLDTDVLVLGGGPAGAWAWAAIAAAEAGACVALADKGRVGSSGATASANTAVIHVAPNSPEHSEVVARRLEMGMGFARVDCIDRVLYETWRNLPRLSDWGYRFARDDRNQIYHGALRGPDYMQILRRRLHKLRVQILDHCPALQLLSSDQVVSGAVGVARVGRGTCACAQAPSWSPRGVAPS
jgi:succinate dehydrogenase/fumarate reductase flavoprotein subunit